MALTSVALRKLLLFLLPADSGILRMDWLVRFVFANAGQHGVDGFDTLLAFFHAPHDGNGGFIVSSLNDGDFTVQAWQIYALLSPGFRA